ncbi:hypothetical protein [Cobetia sp. ICG0124]|uniref:hypothetical protein n=1 Tax=Cobetia sp. ICG0124 TaxID=2053669 RepID=UPI000FDB6A5C|nr:hypothetical protein [Cobetia sp. ICG0124]
MRSSSSISTSTAAINASVKAAMLANGQSEAAELWVICAWEPLSRAARVIQSLSPLTQCPAPGLSKTA